MDSLIFLGGGGLTIFLNVGTEFPHRSRLLIYRILIRRVTKVFLKISPLIYGIPLVTIFRDHGLSVDYDLFIQASNLGPVPMACTKIVKEEVISLLKQLDMN